MGNLASSRRPLLEQRFGTYGAVLDEDRPALNESNAPDSSEYFSNRKRNLALAGILVCQLFDWVSFTTVTVWTPLTFQLNAYFFTSLESRDESYIIDR